MIPNMDMDAERGGYPRVEAEIDLGAIRDNLDVVDRQLEIMYNEISDESSRKQIGMDEKGFKVFTAQSINELVNRKMIESINAAVRPYDLSYSKFMHGLKLANININRKMLSEIAIHDEKGFKDLVDASKNALNA